MKVFHHDVHNTTVCFFNIQHLDFFLDQSISSQILLVPDTLFHPLVYFDTNFTQEDVFYVTRKELVHN